MEPKVTLCRLIPLSVSVLTRLDYKMRRLSSIGICCLLLVLMLAVTSAEDEADDTRQKRQFGGALGFFNGLAAGYGGYGYGYGYPAYYSFQRYPYYGNPYFYGGYRPYRPYHYGHRYGYGWGGY